jgi:hypothetical protein
MDRARATGLEFAFVNPAHFVIHIALGAFNAFSALSDAEYIQPLWGHTAEPPHFLTVTFAKQFQSGTHLAFCGVFELMSVANLTS